MMRIKMYKSGKYWTMAPLLIAGMLAVGAVNGFHVSANPVSPAVAQGNNQSSDNNNPVGGSQTLANTWNTAHTQYFDNNGQPSKGLVTINSVSYYFDDSGHLVTNFDSVLVNNVAYSADTSGVLTAKNGLVAIDDNAGYIYYSNGVKQVNAWETVDNALYYFGSDGKAVTGLQTIGNDQYYFGNDNSYKLQVNFDMTINGLAYHADNQGRLLPKNGTIWGFGDSTTVGWNSYNDGSQSYDAYAAHDLGKLYRNTSAYSGTQIGNDMGWMTDQAVADPNFGKATEIVIALGVNDINFGGGKNLNTIAQIFQDNIRRLHAANPNIKIYVLLPQGNWWQGQNNDSIGKDGFSMNQLRDTLRQVANSLGVYVIDAGVVNDDNHTETVPDGVHPTNATYQAIGQKVAAAITNNPNNNYHDSYQNYDLGNVSGYVNTLSGWRWLENGLVYTGFRYYMGTYYWFVNGVRQNAGWRSAWGRLYYTDNTGRAVQGIYSINGQEFDFGNDGTFYMRSSGYLYDGSSQNGGYRWYENGKLFTGFRYYAGTYYWFVDGVRQNAGWRQAWGYTYYTDDSGRAVQGIQNIDGKMYDFGNDGTFYARPLSGYLWDGSQYNGGYRWYENGQLYTGFRYYMGTYYWFVDGVRQNAGWRQAWGYTYYTDNDGRAVQGHQNFDGQNYYFGDNGTFYLR